MSNCDRRYTPRGYQQYILGRIDESRGHNILIELDCGLGKRYITHQLVSVRYPNLRFIIIVHSSSSLAETIDYLRNEYGGFSTDVGEISSRTPSGRRHNILQEKRVIVTTAQVLTRVLETDPLLIGKTDAVLINEVDTIVRRSGGNSVLVYPWPMLFEYLRGKWLIGMSGTLRDEHAVFNEQQIEIRRELATLQEYIPNTVLISMEDLYGTDVTDYIHPTVLRIERVVDNKIRSIILVLDELIRNTRLEIMQELSQRGELELIQGDPRHIHLLIDTLPVSDELKAQYGGLLMLRKYVYGMPPHAFIRMFRGPFLRRYFNIYELRKSLPEISAKAVRTLVAAMTHEKTLVVTSYLEMVESIREMIERAGVGVLTLTGQTRDKSEVLRAFREDPDKRVLIMSPVGERDLDIPHAEVMIVCDVINTTKTMYQKLKRTRGGLVLLLAYADTSEERKVERLVESILKKYPWSTVVTYDETTGLGGT